MEVLNDGRVMLSKSEAEHYESLKSFFKELGLTYGLKINGEVPVSKMEDK